MPVLVVGLYFDVNVVHISNIMFFYCVKGVKNKIVSATIK